MVSALLYDPARVRVLALKMAAAIQWLDSRTSDEPTADDPIATLRRISHTLGTTWMPYLSHLLGDTSMLTWDAAAPPAPPAAPLGFRSSGSADDDRRPDQIAAEMVELADASRRRRRSRAAGARSDAVHVRGRARRHLRILAATRRRTIHKLVVELETGTRFVGDGLLATSEVIAARDRVLAAMVPTPMDMATDPDFELATAIMSGGDWTNNSSEWSNLINPGCVDLGGPMPTIGGGGFVTGPDGLTVPDRRAVGRRTARARHVDIGPEIRREPWPPDGACRSPSVGNLNGAITDGPQVGYQSGIERFQDAAELHRPNVRRLRRHHRHW